MALRLLCLFLLWAVPFVGEAQQLLWERIYNPLGAQNTYLMCCSLTPQGLLLVPGCTRPRGLTTCQGVQQVFGLYDLNGMLVREQLGRRQVEIEQGLRPGTGSRYWWAGLQPVCTAPLSAGSYVQRLTLRGDTLPAWPLLAPVPPEHRALAVLEDGRRLLVAGYEVTRGANLQIQRYTLTSVDTASGQVRWRHAYDRPPFANDYPIDLVKTPRGGYLISGDGPPATSPYPQHLFLETDSLGNQLKQRLIYPLGLNFNSGHRFSTGTNLRALPNPASETVQLHATGPVPAGSRVELLELATGRLVLTHALTADGRAQPLDVRSLAPGVYAARLLNGSQLLGTTKVVVVR